MSVITTEKNKQWRMESLMESLRQKSTSKSFVELAKTTRMNLLEKKYSIDAIEKQTLQTALDNLQNNITIKNRTQLVERLEMITRRQLSLKFMENVNTNSIFISSDMFYLEILLDPAGTVNDVKVHHECLPESSSEPYLVEVLRKGDFIDFTQQLEGFQQIYQLNCESKIKSKALQTLQAIEHDLMSIYSLENSQNITPEAMVVSSSVGLLTRRRGGHPLKLTFFVRPNELLNLEMKQMDTLQKALQNAEISKKSIGDSVTINLEAAAPSNKLQIYPLLIKNGKPDGNYNFQPISSANSTMLPATFVMCFNKSFPIANSIVESIKRITSLNVFEETSRSTVKIENPTVELQKEQTSLLNLVINVESQGVHVNAAKGLFVSLTDQSHCYFICDNPDLCGISLKTIQFTEPSQAIKIIKLLRTQALFNAIIASCVRQNSRQDLESSYMFELNIVSLQFIQIFIEHPLKETMITVELDLTDVRQICCKINDSDADNTKLESYIQKILQKTCSIPMVTRSLIKHFESEVSELRMQKRPYNSSDVYGIPGPSNNEKKDEQKDENSNGNDDSYGGSAQDSTFDICGINKNEIFFKTTGGEKRLRSDEADVDIFDQRHNKMSRMMGYELDDENEEILMPERNILADELLHNENSSISPISSGSSESSKKNFIPKSGSIPSQKSVDIFEFNDPSPPHQLPIQSPKRIPTPRESPSIEIIPLKTNSMEMSPSPSSSITITPINNSANFFEKLKSEKKKKRKREDGSEMPKKSSDSLGGSSPSTKKSPSSQMMGKPQASFKPDAIMIDQNSKHNFTDSIDELAFLNSFDQSQQPQGGTTPSPLPSPQSLQSKLQLAQQAANRGPKSSLNAVIDKLKSEMDCSSMTPPTDKKGEYQIKSSGTSGEGIKITFNKTKKLGDLKSPKHTGLKPGIQAGPASKKSQSSKNASSSSQKLLFQKSSSSSSLPSTSSSNIPSPKSTSQPGKSSSAKKDPSSFFNSSSNDMLKNMLNLPSPTPRVDLMKAFDKKFQIPKLSSRPKSEIPDETHARSAPTTPSHPMAPSPTMEYSQFSLNQPQKFFSNVQQQKFVEQQQMQKKLYKSASSEQLYEDNNRMSPMESFRPSDADFQAFLRAQSKNDMNMGMMESQQGNSNNLFDADLGFIND